MKFKTLDDLGDVSGKKVFVRVDYNVPLREGGIIEDDFRIKKSIQTIEELLSKGATVILGSHFEGHGGSLSPIANYLRTYFPVQFVSDIYEEFSFTESVVLLENMRAWEGEKKNDTAFAKHLASLADIYVNEAFSASHREHASIVGVPQYLPSFAGRTFVDEVENLSKVFSPAHPFLFILGGAKFSTKLPLLRKFLSKADTVFVGGALANTFYKAQGLEVGNSLVDDVDVSDMVGADHLLLPQDVVVETEGGEVEVRDVHDIQEGDVVMDMGPDSVSDLQMVIDDASFVLWNGPLGNYEKGFAEGTNECAHRIAESGTDCVLGGGDTLTVVSKLHLFEKYSFVSSAGGAMLDFLANETLPGIEALT